MKYEDFVNELRQFLQEARNLFDLDGFDEDPAFRKWRHNVTDLIERIEDKGYEINTSIQSRDFCQQGSYTYDPTHKDHLKAFNRDLQDTINEFETIIERFEKYGDSKSSANNNEKSVKQLEWPPKMTLSWLFLHAPISLWMKASGIILASLLLGLAVGQSQMYKELSSKFTKNSEPNNQVQPTQKPRAAD